jgi:hypothetical protein
MTSLKALKPSSIVNICEMQNRCSHSSGCEMSEVAQQATAADFLALGTFLTSEFWLECCFTETAIRNINAVRRFDPSQSSLVAAVWKVLLAISGYLNKTKQKKKKGNKLRGP